MRKQYIDFEDEEKNTQDFLQKLNKFKTASKNIKQKTKQTTHKYEWQKEYTNLIKQEKELNRDIEKNLSQIDTHFKEEIKENKIFKEKEQSNFYDYYTKDCEQFEIFDLNIWYQVQNFRKIVQDLKKIQDPSKKLPKIKQNSYQQKQQQQQKGILKQKETQKQTQNKKDNEELTQIKELYEDIKQFMIQMKQISNEEYDIMGIDKINRFYERQGPQELQQNQQNIKDYIILEEDDENENDQEDFNENNTLQKEEQINQQLQDINESDFAGIIGYIRSAQEEDLALQGEEHLILQQYMKALKFLKERYQLEILRIKNEYSDDKQDFQNINFIKDDTNYIHFLYIFKTYYKKGKDRDFYMNRLQMHFPNIKKPYLEKVHQHLQNQEFKDQKLESQFRNYNRERKELKEKAEQQIMNLLNIRIEESKKSIQQLKNKQEKERLIEELEAKKKIFEIKQAKINAEKNMQKEIQELQEIKKQKVWQQHAQEQKQKAVVYHQQQRNIQQQKIERQQKEQLLQKQKQKEEILKNAPKVMNRQIQSYQKIQENINRVEEKQMRKEYQQQRLEQAVQNYTFRPQVEQDPQRLIQETEARKIRQVTKMDMGDKVDIENRQGYAVNDLMKDMRYRLGVALQDAGLQNAQYSKQVLTQMSVQNQQERPF